MFTDSKNKAISTIKVDIQSKDKDQFVHWQAELNAKITTFPGFISLEILSPIDHAQAAWLIVQHFHTSKDLAFWRASPEYLVLMNELKKILSKNPSHHKEIEETLSETSTNQNQTEVFITQVSPDKEEEYRKWIAKIHQAEAKFPGFRGVYVQAPSQGQGQNWVTLLQFDTPEHLDHWLSSAEREEILKESKSLISALESHRMISSYAGWFSSVAKDGKLPPVWKQTMLVLLVLFPIVMLEFKFLSLVTSDLNLSLATFIGNALSVTLIAWPMMPIAIWSFRWWLVPKKEETYQMTLLGVFLLFLLYLAEIAIFWTG